MLVLSLVRVPRGQRVSIDPDRILRALALSVEWLTDGRYLVTGGASPHIVKRTSSGWTCDCLDSVYNRGQPCKHRLARHIHQRLHPTVVDSLLLAVEGCAE